MFAQKLQATWFQSGPPHTSCALFDLTQGPCQPSCKISALCDARETAKLSPQQKSREMDNTVSALCTWCVCQLVSSWHRRCGDNWGQLCPGNGCMLWEIRAEQQSKSISDLACWLIWTDSKWIHRGSWRFCPTWFKSSRVQEHGICQQLR